MLSLRAPGGNVLESMEDAEDELEAYCRTRVGTTLQGKWKLDTLLGLGGMAAVYAATHRNGTTAARQDAPPAVRGDGEARAAVPPGGVHRQ